MGKFIQANPNIPREVRMKGLGHSFLSLAAGMLLASSFLALFDYSKTGRIVVLTMTLILLGASLILGTKKFSGKK